MHVYYVCALYTAQRSTFAQKEAFHVLYYSVLLFPLFCSILTATCRIKLLLPRMLKLMLLLVQC